MTFTGGVRTWLAHRWRLARCLGQAPPILVGALALALLISCVTPAASAVALADLVSRLRDSAGGDLFRHAVPGLVLFAAVLAASHAADAVSQPLEYLAKARIDGRHRDRVAVLAATTPGVGPLEDGDVQALIREAKADPETGAEFTPGDGALAQLRWAAALAGAAAACAVVAAYQWWLIPLLLIPSAVNRYIRSRRAFAHNDKWRLCLAEEMHADVWRKATVSSGEGKDVRIFGFASWMVDRMQAHIERGNRPMWSYAMHVVRTEWNQFLLVAVGLVPAYVAVAVSAAHGSASIGVQTAVFAAGWSLYQAFGTSADLYRMVGATGVLKASDRLESVLEKAAVAAPAGGSAQSSDGSQADAATPAAAPAPAIRFQDVSFTYPGTDRAVLNGLDLEIRPGELLAVVGLNGAGKSTLIKLLTALYEPTAGAITADGRVPAQWGLDRWRSATTVVFQDFIRYQLSALDNVTLGQGRIPASRAAAEAAAHDVGFDDRVAALPAGWDTVLARTRDGGVDLSGGQWQQVALSRALYAVNAGARVLVLDEPTAHLDVRTEAEVFQHLTGLRGRASVVLISHRLSTVRHADRIVLLEGGRITESGTHEELMALGGGYCQMFTIQAGRLARGYDDRIPEGELL
ncbi:ABC-type multidrug transport system fused ATPase/permease subunit [Catenulispora sp. GP43]|uniref:ATP-binding cassette domain-containing protein n=1 Tax=Catenulispora sp. GP43 TaxID=3156263 RepID=UPI0035164367